MVWLAVLVKGSFCLRQHCSLIVVFLTDGGRAKTKACCFHCSEELAVCEKEAS